MGSHVSQRGTRRPIRSVTTLAYSEDTVGHWRTPKTGPIRWLSSARISGGFSMCTATFLNGVMTGTWLTLTPEAIRLVLTGARSGCTGAVAGTSWQWAAGRRAAAGTGRRTGTTTWACAWPEFCRARVWQAGAEPITEVSPPQRSEIRGRLYRSDGGAADGVNVRKEGRAGSWTSNDLQKFRRSIRVHCEELTVDVPLYIP